MTPALRLLAVSLCLAPNAVWAATPGKTIDARAMGLACDGSTDNAAVFAAIKARTDAAAGQTVVFPPAAQPCLSSRPLKASTGTTYSARPGTVTLKPTAGNASNPVLFDATQVSEVNVDGLTFDGGLALSSTTVRTAQPAAGTTLAVGNTAGFVAGNSIASTAGGIAPGTKVATVEGAGTITLSQSTTRALAAGAALFSGPTSLNGGNIVTVFKARRVVFDHDLFRNTRGTVIVFSDGVTDSGVRNSRFMNYGNQWKATWLVPDQHQAVAFCCGTKTVTTQAQPSAGTVLTVASTAGMVVGDMAVSDGGGSVPGSGSKSGILPGTRIAGLTPTTVTLSQPTAFPAPAGVDVVDARNDHNFVQDSQFVDGGLDAISIGQQTNFTGSGNQCRGIGGPPTVVNTQSGGGPKALFGGACFYSVYSVGVSITGNVMDESGGNGIDVYLSNDVVVADNKAYHSGSAGVAFGAGSNARISGNVSMDGDQQRVSGPGSSRGGIFLTGGVHTDPALANVVLSGNVSGDDQPTKTQPYGLQIQRGTSGTTNLTIDQSNRFDGNAAGAFGEAATGFTATGATPAGRR